MHRSAQARRARNDRRALLLATLLALIVVSAAIYLRATTRLMVAELTAALVTAIALLTLAVFQQHRR